MLRFLITWFGIHGRRHRVAHCKGLDRHMTLKRFLKGCK